MGRNQDWSVFVRGSFTQVGFALTVLVAYVYTSFDIMLALTELDGAITVEAIIAPKYLISLSVSL